MAVMTSIDATRQAVAEEMRRDPMVWAVGEDLGRGGVFGQYKGLVDEFGPDRISDAPISESCIMGAAVGAAVIGVDFERLFASPSLLPPPAPPPPAPPAPSLPLVDELRSLAGLLAEGLLSEEEFAMAKSKCLARYMS